MKKLLWGILCAVLLFCPTITASAGKEKAPEVFVNGQKVIFKDVSPTIINGRTMIPIRKVSEVIGEAKIEYNNGNIKINNGVNYVSMNIGNKQVVKNGKSITIDVAPLLVKERTMVPVRFISEALDAKVGWNNQTYIVSINTETSIPVLMYHHFSEKIVDGNTTIKPSEFKEHLQYLKKNGFSTISVSDLMAYKEGTASLPENPVLITLDDGYLSNYQYAFPVLKELKMKATIFIVTQDVGNTTLLNPHFNWVQAREMEKSGFVDIQSHTNYSHYKVGKHAALSSPMNGETHIQFKNRVRKDLITSRDLIRRNLGKTSLALAYPYGSYSGSTLKIAKEVGFKMAFTVKKGHVYKQSPQFELDRINIPQGMSGEEVVQLIEDCAY
ncbi:stalk domain-containing protein [Fictibacillus halophilus]|uniref:stalk domain-containing protein n=1 Tax=Fictibacillus halophilus TaxID=1610490 RepID=UPI00363D646C